MAGFGSERPRLQILFQHPGRWAGPIPAVLAALVLIVGCAGPSPTVPPAGSATPHPSPVTASGTPTPSSASPSQAPSPSSSPGAWTRVEVTGLPQVATLAPTKAGAAGVALDTSFRLTSLDGRPAASLASRLVADPPLTFVVASASGTTAVVRPTAALRAGTLYRISLPRPDGSVEASWSALAAGPLHVSDSVPGDHSTRVPLDTGIEITFDQYGVTPADLKSHFTIAPAAAGRFEAASRSIAFVPDRPLLKGTVYTVTVTRGLPLAGTGEVLGASVVISFETATTAPLQARATFQHALVDATPRDLAALTLWLDIPDGVSQPRTVPVTVHRLPDMAAAEAAYVKVAAAPDWTETSTQAPVATTGLTQLISATIDVRTYTDGAWWIQLPRSLPAGWYLVTMSYAGIPRQAILQVTDTATFALVATDRTAVWVNDLRTGAPATGATASLGGHELGGADARGLIVAATPAAVAEASSTAEPLLVVRYAGETSFRPIPLGSQVCGKCAGVDGLRSDASVRDRWWTLLTTDRALYRSTDTLNVLGIARNRDTGSAAASVTLSVQAGDAGASAPVAISTTTATPDRRGMFSASIAIRDLPVGSYLLRMVTGRDVLGEIWFSVATIVKPAWALTVTTSQHAVLEGSAVTASAHAAFFEGTPVAGTRLTLGSDDGDSAPTTAATTDLAGNASGKVTVRIPSTDEQWSVVNVRAVPTLPEEAEISATSSVAVFRATALVSTNAQISGTSLSIGGSVNSVAFTRFEAPGAASDLWSVNPLGAGRAGAAVAIKVVEHVPYRVQTGTAYDFITKRVAPLYEVRDRAATIATRTVRTGTTGTYQLALAVAGGTRWYDVSASYTDEAGRRVTANGGAQGPERLESTVNPWLSSAEPGHDDARYSLGEAVRVRFDGGLTNPPMARYLYAVTGRGLRYVTIGSTPTFRTTFTASDVPSIGISAVRFNGSGYEVAVLSYRASLRVEDRRLTVQLTPDKSRYQPGDTASVSIRTLGPDGRPVAASVFVGVVDEKLYAMGAAYNQDPLGMLYGDLSDGVVGWVASHRTPRDDSNYGKGDTTGGGGGGDRTDFRDWLLARVVTTGSDGRAQVAVPLSDDLTSWRVTGTAVDAALNAGFGTGTLQVGLPFFVDATIAPEYLAADRPIIRVRSFGNALTADARVTFTVSSDTLPMAATTVTAAGFATAEVPLPKLSIGTQKVRIEASTGTGTARRTDVLVRTFRVVATRVTQLRTTWTLLAGPTVLQTGPGLTSVTLVDAGRGRVVPLLQALAGNAGTRSDRELAAALANRVLVDQFGLSAVTTTDETGMIRFIGADGITVVPWGSGQLEMTALAAMTGDPRLEPAGLRRILNDAVANLGEPRERRLFALAGLAALGEPVLGQVREAAALADLSVPERVDVALAALLAGDEALAGRLEQQLLAQNGLRSAGQVRLDVATDPAVFTARLATVAASLGDPLAADMDAWLAANPPTSTTVDLERALAARGWARRVAGATAVAVVIVDGSRRQVTIQPDAPVALALTPAQAATARLERVSGSILVVQAWDDALGSASLTPSPGQTLQRVVSPSGAIGPTDTVVVTFDVNLGSQAGEGCWRLVELVPSGLAPISSGGWFVNDSGESWPGLTPDNVDGQRVEFCVARNEHRPDLVLRYVARVVTPGTYTWEPAVLQSETDPARGIVLDPVTISIRGSAG